MANPSPPPDETSDATGSVPPAAEVPSASAPVPIPPESSAHTPSAGVGPGQADTGDPDDLSDHTDDVNTILLPAQQAGELGRLGRYRVLRELGRGGMGVVFEAEDEMLKRRVALKVMLPSLAVSAAARRRFVREAQTAARVAHDNIVPIHDIAEANGVPFIAMPLLVGESLGARLKRGAPLPMPEVLTIGREIALGLAAAHAVGLIHRDIKPDNVWLERTPEGAFKRVRVLDFGLSRPVQNESELTARGVILGTPAYMAPEQARGATVDHRADLFSLGCVLYVMATGRRAFSGADTFAVLTALATETPPAPIAVNPAVPAALSMIIERLLTKNPDHRWPPTAREIADELHRVASDPFSQPVLPPLPPRPSEPDPSSSLPVELSQTVVVEPSAHDSKPPKSVRGRAEYIAFAALLGALALVVVFSGKIVNFAMNRGHLRIETDDRNIEVTVRHRGEVIASRTSDRNFDLLPGDGEVTFHDPRDGAPTVSYPYYFTRGGSHTVRATRTEIISARPKPYKPEEKKTDPLPEDLRKALEWITSAGGTVRGRKGKEPFEASSLGTFPDPPFTITEIDFNKGFVGARSDKAEALRALPAFEGHLNLSSWTITDAVWERLSSFPALRGAAEISLDGSQVTDAALARLSNFPNLVSLSLQETRIDNDALKYLERCPRLTQLNLRRTRVNSFGVKKFAGAHPNCRIEYESATIEATTTGNPVDLLALVDPKRDTVAGRWKLDGGALVGGGTTPTPAPWYEALQIAYAPPTEYDLVTVVQRNGIAKDAGPTGPSFALTVTGPYRCQVVLDARERDEVVNGIRFIDGKNHLSNDTRTWGNLFGPDGEPIVITCRVRNNGIEVLTDGHERFKWKGDVSKLSHDDLLWKLPDKTRLAISVQNAEYRISEWRLYPLVAPRKKP